MATSGKFAPEVDALPKGMDLRSLRHGPYLSNLRLDMDGDFHLRGGLGVLREFDSHLSAGPETLEIGPRKRLGTYVARTGLNGTEQLLVVSSAVLNRGDDSSAPTQPSTLLHVYDLDNRRIAEHVLMARSDDTATNMPYALPACWMPSNAAPTGNEDVSFAIMDGVVLFGSSSIGLWAYTAPSTPTGHADRSASHQSNLTRRAPYGESCVVWQLIPTNGPFVNYLYLDKGDLPNPTCLTTWQNRLVLASQRTLYFSDPLNPSWWITDNRVPVPCAGLITSIAGSRDVILVWTESETWAYNPPNGSDILSGGQWYRLSDSTGCQSPRSVTLVGATVTWGHSTGVFSHQSGTSFNKLSEALDPFFQGAEPSSNPLNLYRLATGNTDPSVPQPPIEWFYERPILSFHERRGELFVSFPNQAFAWVWRAGQWLLWQTGSIANATNVVQLNQTLPDIEWIGTSGTVLAVSRTSQTILDRVVHATCVLEVGRGGALDRSEQYKEDDRTWNGQWELTSLNDMSPDDGEVWIGQPVVRDPGFTTGTGQVLASQSFWFPVYLIAPSNIAAFDVQDVDVRFQFDTTNWTVVHVNPPTPEIDFDTPKIAAIGGFSPGAPIVGSEVRTYQGGAPAIGGNEIRIRYDGSLSVADTTPNLNTQPRTPTLLCWIPMIRDPNATSSINPWTAFNQADMIDVTGGLTTSARARWYMFASRLGDDLIDDNQSAMPVDWALKTDQIGSGKEQLKCRGTYARVSTSGKASGSIVAGYMYGLVNATTSSDYKDWATETVDIGIPASQIPPAQDDLPNEETLRSRLYTTSVQKQTYNGVARWGSFATPADGNILSGDRPVDTFATSEGIRGEHFSTMLWGSSQNSAERVAIETMVVTLREVGGRRRTGR